VKSDRIAAAILSIAAALLLWWWATSHSSPATAAARAAANATQAHGTPATVVSTPSAHPAARSVAVSALREDSLRGTAVDGAVNFDSAGLPVADRDLRRLFDYFLARLGERDPRVIRDELSAYLRDVVALDTGAQNRVVAWFDAYVAVQREAIAMPRSGDLVEEAARLRTLHREQLGDELASAWFGREDAYAAYTAQRLVIAQDNKLDASDKAERLAALEQTLAPGQRAEIRDSTDFQLAVAQTRQLDAQRTDAAARFSERAALWGEDAAVRLDILDQARAAWDERVATYARLRAAVIEDGSISPASRAAQLSNLLSAFSEPEQRRLLSLAQANALPQP